MMIAPVLIKNPLPVWPLPSSASIGESYHGPQLFSTIFSNTSRHLFLGLANTEVSSFVWHPRIHRSITASVSSQSTPATPKLSMAAETVPSPPMKLLFVEMGVGYDQHGQDITSAAMRACRDAISSNSIPAFRRGSIPGVTFNEMKLQIKLGVPRPLQNSLDIEKVKSVFPYGKILNVEVVDGGLICSSGVHVEEMGDQNDDCYIVNSAVYVEWGDAFAGVPLRKCPQLRRIRSLTKK